MGRDNYSVMRTMPRCTRHGPGMQSGVLYQVRRAACFFPVFVPHALSSFAVGLLFVSDNLIGLWAEQRIGFSLRMSSGCDKMSPLPPSAHRCIPATAAFHAAPPLRFVMHVRRHRHSSWDMT